MIIDIFKDDVDILPYAQSMDLRRNINIYNLLTLERDDVFLQLKNEVRDYIKLKYKNIKIIN